MMGIGQAIEQAGNCEDISEAAKLLRYARKINPNLVRESWQTSRQSLNAQLKEQLNDATRNPVC